jgi:hypothetical protein
MISVGSRGRHPRLSPERLALVRQLYDTGEKTAQQMDGIFSEIDKAPDHSPENRVDQRNHPSLVGVTARCCASFRPAEAAHRRPYCGSVHGLGAWELVAAGERKGLLGVSYGQDRL